MQCGTLTGLFFLTLCVGAAAADLSLAPSEELLRVYANLRQLQGSEQYALTENVVWKRDAATFTFRDGRLTFAAPVEGRVLAAVFTGRGSFELSPPTPIDRQQIARFAGGPRLEDGFREAVFFFTDNSWDELGKLVKLQPGGDAQAATKALESAQKKYSEDFNEWWGNQRKGSFAMRNLAARMLADLSDPSSRGFFLADFRTDHHDELFYHVSWNRDPLFPTGFGTDEEVMLMRYKRGEYSEWWSGFHLSEEYAKNPHPEHRTLLARCREERIDAEVSKSNHLAATAEMEYEVPGGSARVLPLTLQGVLRISSITDGAGKKLSFVQEDRKLDSDAWVILPEPARAGQAYKLRLAYEEDSTRDSRIIHQQGSGLYFVGARESWYPSFGAFDDRTHFFLHFRSPKKYTFVATGHPVSDKKEGDILETEWESEIPYSVVGFNYGAFVHKSQADASVTVTAYSGSEVPDEVAMVARSGAVGSLTTTTMAQSAAAQSFQALKLYTFYFGSLPFKDVSVTEQPVRGFGQSWPTLIFLPYDSFLDATIRHSLGLDRSAEEREFYNVVAVHEMSHQWWGHLVGWKTYHDQWLSEGFADFSAALYLRRFEPNKFKTFWDLKRKWLLEKNRAGHRPEEVGPLWLNYQLGAYLEQGNPFYLIYYKGAYVLEMLRTLMEDPRAKEPDARFIALMREFVTTYSGKNPSTEDFRRLVEKHMGEPMDWFFNQWVYGTEVPHYDFSYQLKDAGDGKTALHLSMAQSGVSDSFQMGVPVYMYVNGQPRRLGLIRVRGSNTTTGDVTLPIRPEKVVLDEFHSVLSTVRQ